MTQRNGRIIRQGNQNKQVYVYNYVTESTFDAYLYQTLENKQKFISQIMTSKSPMTVAACLKNRTDYIENPDKTEQGQYVSSYACSALTADEEFMLTKRQYDLVNGRRQKNDDVIAYQIRQSFRPGKSPQRRLTK